MLIYPNSTLRIDDENYHFTRDPSFPKVPYTEFGNRSKVYRLESQGRLFTLKVFWSEFRNPKSVENCVEINQYEGYPGLAASRHTVRYPK